MFLIMNTIAQFFLVIPNTVVWAFIADVVNTDNGNSDYVQKVSLIQAIALLKSITSTCGFRTWISINVHWLST